MFGNAVKIMFFKKMKIFLILNKKKKKFQFYGKQGFNRVSKYCLNFFYLIKCLFGSVVEVVFKSVFRLEIHQNNFFLFFKIYFWYQHIKMIKTHKKINLKLKN